MSAVYLARRATECREQASEDGSGNEIADKVLDQLLVLIRMADDSDEQECRGEIRKLPYEYEEDTGSEHQLRMQSAQVRESEVRD